MDAADDICYCTSDISDAITKGVITNQQFKEYFRDEWGNGQLPDVIEAIGPSTHFPTKVAVTLSRKAVAEVAEYFCAHFDELATDGAEFALLAKTPVGAVYETLKRVAKKHIYTNRDVQRIEIAGYNIIKGLLDRLDVLTTPEREEFWEYITSRDQPHNVQHKLAWRVLGLLGKRVKEAFCMAHNASPSLTKDQEKLLRYRMIVDYVAGLTDQHALALHQLFTGSSL
jgi:dGTPase